VAGSNAIDLSRLPAPTVVEALDFETIFEAMRADLVARDPTLAPALAVESEPLVKLLQVCAFRELGIRNRVNQAARAVMPAFAIGSDLDQLAALLNVERQVITPADPIEGTPAVLESDEDLRRRLVLAPEGFSVAGPEGAYVFHALSADPLVRDASAVSPTPGDVVVTVLSRAGNGEASPALVAIVEAAVSPKTVRPITDNVTVQSAEIVEYTIEAQVFTYAGPDVSIVLDEAIRRVQEFAANQYRLGRDVNLSAIMAALHAEGVQRVELVSPVANLVITPAQASFCTAFDVTHGGFDE
jgi:phage-related baseplate assembly protein